MYRNSWMSCENWDMMKREEEAIFLTKCLIFQVYFLLAFVSPLPMSQGWHVIESHLTSAALHLQQLLSPPLQHFCQCYLLFSLLRHKSRAAWRDSELAHTHCHSLCWATCVLGWATAQLGFVVIRVLGGTKQLLWPSKDPCAELHQIKGFMLQAEDLDSKSVF